MNPDDLRQADAIEVVIGQGAKPGGGGMLLGQKIDARVAEMRTLPTDIDQRSACVTPIGPALTIWKSKSANCAKSLVGIASNRQGRRHADLLRHLAGGQIGRRRHCRRRHAGHRRDQGLFIEHVGIPTLPAVRLAADALRELGLHRGAAKLIVSGGIRSGADVAKAIALGADAVSLGTAALIALGDNSPDYAEDYAALGSRRVSTNGRAAATRPGSPRRIRT